MIAPREAHAEPAAPGPEHDVTDHGAVGDGVTDDTEAFQKAIDAIADAGGGTLLIPAKSFVLAPVTAVVLRADDMTVHAEGATFLRPYRESRPSAMFVANTRGTPGYGAGVRNLHWYGGRFVGDLAEDNAICPFALHHAQSCVFERVVSENCHAPNSHQFDLCGCDDITIRHCTFRGQAEIEEARGEAIQIDQSFKGALTGGSENSGFSGLLTRDVTVEHCTFEPFTDDAGTVWPGPTPIGSHSTVEGSYYQDIRFAHNAVTDPRRSTLIGDLRDASRGVVHFISVHGLEIVSNHFTMTEAKQTRVIAINSIDYGPVAEADPEDPSDWPSEYWDVPNNNEDILISDNLIEGFTVEAGDEEYGAIVAHGMPGGELRSITIRDNVVRDGYQDDAADHAAGVETSHVTELRVEDNTIVDYYTGVELADVSDATVRANTVRNETGTEFPAGIVGTNVSDSTVDAGETSGYREAVDID